MPISNSTRAPPLETRDAHPGTRTGVRNLHGPSVPAPSDAPDQPAAVASKARRACAMWKRSCPASIRNSRSKDSCPRSAWSPNRARSSSDDRFQSATFAVAERLEEHEELVGVLVSARVQLVGPQILVVADQRRLVMGQDPSIARGRDHLGVDGVAQALDHRPLPGGGTNVSAVPRFGHQRAPEPRRARLHLRGIVVTEQREQVILIRLGFGDRVRRCGDVHEGSHSTGRR